MKQAAAPASQSKRAAGPGRRAHAHADRLLIPAGGWCLLLWAGLLLLAPPDSNWFWGVNGFRSLSVTGRSGLIVVAAIAAALVLIRRSPWFIGAALGAVVAVTVAFPLRESVHFLGDTQTRLRAMMVFTNHDMHVSLAEWSKRLHANPLDITVNFLGPIGLSWITPSPEVAVSVVSLALALVFFWGVWRVAGRLGAGSETRLALCAALVLSGVLEAFAGYAESAGLLLAAAGWWWAEMLTPIANGRQAARVAIAWLALFLSHRLGLIMLLPLAWRALGPPFPGDGPEARRKLVIFGAAAAVIAAAVLAIGVGGGQLAMDSSELLAAAREMVRAVPPSDLLNELALVAPLALLAACLAGRAGFAGFVARPESRLLLIAFAPLIPLLWLALAGASGLGAHRDWDLGVLAGWTLSLAGASLLARLPSGRLRGALLCALPLLALQAGGWLAVNADEAATMRRARALVERPPGLAAPHLSHLHLFLGQQAMDRGFPQLAAPELEKAFALNPNPRRALMAAEAWAAAGDLAAARLAVVRARAVGPLSPTLVLSAQRIEAMIARMAADTTANGRAGRPSGP